jgi:hypothetical protein
MASITIALGDLWLCGIPAWRKYRGGDWYFVRTNMHPQLECWTNDPPDGIYESLIRAESHPPAVPRTVVVLPAKVSVA